MYQRGSPCGVSSLVPRSTAAITSRQAQKKLAHRFKGPVRIRNVRIFDPVAMKLTGPSQVIVFRDRITRLLPEVMGNEASGEDESFENGLLEHPHYTRPQNFEGLEIPAILTSGNHGKIATWRREEAERLTAERRPDIFGAYEKPASKPTAGKKSPSKA